ncbi:DNA repair protein xrcc3 [Entomortierella beljakovae]|nr:DNA repair protein xrcc3 [Entomortierella beljakovae]
MTSINVLDLSSSIKDALIKATASLDTVEDLLLYTPPSLVDDISPTRPKRHQPTKGATSTSYDRLMNLTPDEVALAYDQASAYIFESRIAYGTAQDLLQEEFWLSLGDPILDAALGGSGFMTRGITEIAGESAVGKTQLCLQLCLTVQLPLNMGGLDGSAVWLSTEGKFPYSRLESMIGHFVSKHIEAIPDLNAGDIRDNIYFDSMADQETQLHIFNYQLPVLIHDSHANEETDENGSNHEGDDFFDGGETLRRPRKKPIKLVIIDSITNNFRSELTVYTPDQMGNQSEGSGFKSSILQRSADICEIGLRLRTLADQYGLTVICVNQVTDVFESETNPYTNVSNSRGGASVFHSLDDPMKHKKPALGLVWENTINARIILQRTRQPEHHEETLYPENKIAETQRTLSVMFSPWAANNKSGDSKESGHCRYKIDETGVVGVPIDQ